MSDSLGPHELQHARLPCPSPSPWVCSNSCPSSRWCHPTISSSVAPLLFLPSIIPSIRVFSNEPALCIMLPKYRSFNFNTSPSNEYSGLISFRMDWFDLLAVQGTLKSLLQHWTSKTSVLWCWTFFMVQLSHRYMTAGKPWLWLYVPLLGFPCGSVGKESTGSAGDLGSIPGLGRSAGEQNGYPLQYLAWGMHGPCSPWGHKESDVTEWLAEWSLLLNTLSGFVIAFLPRSNCLLISRLQSPAAVILEPKKKKSVTTSTFSASIWQWDQMPWS